MANPFRMHLPDGSYSSVATRSIELLLHSTGAPVAVEGPDAAQDAQWATHAVPLLSTLLYVAGERLPLQIDWNKFSESLVLKIGPAGDMVRYIIGRHQLTEGLEQEQRLTHERRAALQVTVSVHAEQVEEFRQLIEDLNEDEDGGDDFDGDEEGRRHSAAFYDEHPELAPDPGPQVNIASATDYETFTIFRLSVSDANLAYTIGRIWQKREQAPAAGSLEAREEELSSALGDVEGYGWSLARLTVQGENWLGEPVEAEQAWEELVFLQLQMKAAQARAAMLSKLLAKQREGGQANG